MRLQDCAALLMIATLFACGSSPKPEARVASTEAAIRGAQEAGAQSVPKATLHLKLAREEQDNALALIKDGDNKRAEYVLMKAEADAELAVALAREASAKADAQNTLEQVQALKKKASQ